MDELLKQAIDSGQVSAAQIEQHRAAGELQPQTRALISAHNLALVPRVEQVMRGCASPLFALADAVAVAHDETLFAAFEKASVTGTGAVRVTVEPTLDGNEEFRFDAVEFAEPEPAPQRLTYDEIAALFEQGKNTFALAHRIEDAVLRKNGLL